MTARPIARTVISLGDNSNLKEIAERVLLELRRITAEEALRRLIDTVTQKPDEYKDSIVHLLRSG